MPELPEVETTLRGLSPYLQGNTIVQVSVYCRKLRWPIPIEFESRLLQQPIQKLSRRGKYMLFYLKHDVLLIHLGMSGRLHLLTHPKHLEKHDHVEITFADNMVLRYNDPRRFGAMLLTSKPPMYHPLLSHLGVEPLSSEFRSEYLLQSLKNKSASIKSSLMDSKIVVGIGNIYAAESLFLAGIHPAMPAKQLTKTQAEELVKCVQNVLLKAIEKGGTTLKDFLNSEGKPGYFAQQLNVYGRGGKPCLKCQTMLVSCLLGQRSTVYCPICQAMDH